jgi:ABC-2 type transport system ATP-binding protein
VFLSTHTLEVAEALCDRIAILYEGSIRSLGSMEELRVQAETGTAGLEDIFLKLTRSEGVKELVAALRAGPE